MQNSLKLRVEKALERLNLHYRDVSDPEDASVLSAYFGEMTTERGQRMPWVVSLSRGAKDIWVQGGIEQGGAAIPLDEGTVRAVEAFDADLQHLPAGLFSQFKLPRFHSRGFQAHVTWSSAQGRIVSTVIIPAGEFSSATLDGSLRLAAHLGTMALARLGETAAGG